MDAPCVRQFGVHALVSIATATFYVTGLRSSIPGAIHMGGCQDYSPFLGTLNIRCAL